MEPYSTILEDLYLIEFLERKSNESMLIDDNILQFCMNKFSKSSVPNVGYLLSDNPKTGI